MAIHVNHSAIANGRSLIEAGKISHSAWDAGRVPRDAAHSASFAGTDEDFKPSQQGHWKYPFIADGEVSSIGLGNALARAEKNAPDVAAALKPLSDLIKEKSGKQQIQTERPNMPSKFKFTAAGQVRVPVSSTRFKGTVTFSEPSPGTPSAPPAGANPVGPVPTPNANPSGAGPEGGTAVGITIKARSGEAVDHPFWGKIAHDFSGLQNMGKDRIPLDYAHMGNDNPEHVIGYADLNGINLANPDLILPGKLTPQREGDSASTVLHRMRAGVPMESSIDFGRGPMSLEYVDKGATAQCNGREFTGPGVIARKWPLSGVSLCAFGADGDTGVCEDDGEGDGEEGDQFSSPRKFVTVTIFKADRSPSMPAINHPAATADTAPAALTAAPANFTVNIEQPSAAASMPAAITREQMRAEAQKFTAAFGDKGAAWYFEGKTFDQAQAQFATDKAQASAAEVETLRKEKAELEKKLAAAPRGNVAAANQAETDAAHGGTVSAPSPRAMTRKFANGMEFGDPGVHTDIVTEGFKMAIDRANRRPA